MGGRRLQVTIYHNPRCSKSRQTLELLRDHDPVVIDYLKEPPSVEELERILKMLGLQPRELMRKKEPIYRDLNLDNPELDRAALLKAMAEHPNLIERPIVIKGAKAALGRPPENVLDIL